MQVWRFSIMSGQAPHLWRSGCEPMAGACEEPSLFNTLFQPVCDAQWEHVRENNWLF